MKKLGVGAMVVQHARESSKSFLVWRGAPASALVLGQWWRGAPGCRFSAPFHGAACLAVRQTWGDSGAVRQGITSVLLAIARRASVPTCKIFLLFYFCISFCLLLQTKWSI